MKLILQGGRLGHHSKRLQALVFSESIMEYNTSTPPLLLPLEIIAKSEKASVTLENSEQCPQSRSGDPNSFIAEVHWDQQNRE